MDFPTSSRIDVNICYHLQVSQKSLFSLLRRFFIVILKASYDDLKRHNKQDSFFFYATIHKLFIDISEPPSSKKKKTAADYEQPRLTNAIKSFPDEVQLCMSSIPGARYGVCAKEHIPLGTWIGPYEGRRITPLRLSPDIDSAYIWEVGFI